MPDIKIEKLAEKFRLMPQKLLEHLASAGITGKDIKSSVTNDEKIILTEYLKNKITRNKKITTSNTVVVKKPKSYNKTGITIIRRNKVTQEALTAKPIISKDKIDVLKNHQDSIKASKIKEQEFLEQEKKRRQELSNQQDSQKENVTDKPEKAKNLAKLGTKDKDQAIKDKPDNTSNSKPNYKPDNINYNRISNRKLKKKDKTRLSQQLREEQSKQHAFVKPVDPVVHQVSVPDFIKVADIAQQMGVKAGEVLKQMMSMGVRATINDVIDQDTAILVIEEMGHKPIIVTTETVEDIALSGDDLGGTKKPRPPIVALMGHVDHGKTSLLDYIRKTKIAKGETGGITQHIGAYQVDTANGKITFLDTPGHSAFTKMRLRGASATDIVILVVAADDGVMPETIDSIKHAKKSNTAIIVAINKIDKEGANSEKAIQMLSNNGVVSEKWGGDTIMVEISALTGAGIDELLEAITLQAEVLELQAAIDIRAMGVVLEARVEKGRGKIATLLVQEGVLKHGDAVIAGLEYGKIKQIIDDTGVILKSAMPSMPVEVLGLSGVPDAGDHFVVLASEKEVKEIAYQKRIKAKELKLQKDQALKMENFITNMERENIQKLNILVKADVRGSSQALTDALEQLSIDELNIKIVGSGVGAINDSDMALAIASNAVVLGFNVRADSLARKSAEKNGIDIRYYSIIYNLIDDVKAMMSGLIAPELSENILGIAEVKDVFKSKKLGYIAGCIVLEGKVKHNSPIRVLRQSVVIYDGELESLRRFKDEVVEVESGVECGIGVKDYNDIQKGDQIEVFERIEIPVKL